MAKASSYANDATITGTDKLFGTDAADTSSKNFTISGIESFLNSNGTLASVAGAQTLTNKTMDFSSGGTNSITLDSDDVIYNNGTSGLSATNVKSAIDELENEIDAVVADTATNSANIATNQGNISTNAGNISTNLSNINANTFSIAEMKLSYNTDNETTASYALTIDDANLMVARGSGATNMTTSLDSTVLGDLDTDDIIAIHRTGSGTSEISLSGVTDRGGATGTIEINRQGGVAFIKKIDGTNVLIYGDITITP